MNLLDLGSLLKQERERRGLSVRDVMDSTKISRRNLNALEAGEAKLLPHPVYLKGYVRNYARLVGLDPEPLAAVVDQQSDGDSGYVPQKPTPPAAQPVPAASLAEASSELPAPGEPAPTPADPESAPSAVAEEFAAAEPLAQAQPEPAQPAPAPEQPEAVESQIRFPKPAELSPRPRKRLWPWLVLLLLVAGGAGVAYQCQRIQADAEQPPVAPAPVAAPVENATAAADTMNGTDANATLTEPEASAAAIAPAPPAAPIAPTAVPAAPAAPAAAAPPAQSAVPSASIEVSRKAQAQPQTPAQTSGIETRTPGMQELVVVAKPGEVCWVEVSEGQRRKTFTLRDGDSRRFEFSNKAKVRLGNAGGVTFQLNGSFYPYEGQRGQTASIEIGAH